MIVTYVFSPLGSFGMAEDGFSTTISEASGNLSLFAHSALSSTIIILNPS